MAADEYTSEMRAMLEAQLEYVRNDERIREEVAVWRDTTPQERLAECDAMCRDADFFLARLSPEALERALRPEPLPADSIAILEALRRS